MIEYGEYIYIGTCYNPIYGIYYRNLVDNLKGQLGKEKAEEVAKAVIELMYDGAMYYTETSNPAIVKINKESYEVALAYRYEGKNNNMAGYRMAAEYNGKLYFVGSGYPTSALLEIDPENNDEAKIVYERTVQDWSVASGIRGLLAREDELIMSVATDDGVLMLSSTNPSSGEWKVIADQNTFLDLPAYYIRDSINGGGIWDIVEFNGSVYATIVTAKTDAQSMITNKRGFAMFKGDKAANGQWTWEMVIGDKDQGAKYDFGLGVKEASAGNIFVYNNYLYIGNYNDPMLSLAAIPNTGDFASLYYDLKNAISLYRMDAQGNVEMVGGQANSEFPQGPIGNMGVGLGSNMNQYVWRLGEYNGKLFIGTYDTATISNAFTQLTNGEILHMDKEEFLRRVNQIKAVLEAFLKNKAVKYEAEEPLNNEESTEVIITDETEDIKEEYLAEESIENINELMNLLDSIGEELDETPQATTYRMSGSIVDSYNKLVEIYNLLKPMLPEEVTTIIEKLIEDLMVENFVYYFGINEYCMQAEKGFDLLVSEDGVNFEVITRNGFNDKYNHGVRTFQATEQGLFIGAANPFYGAQVWLLTDKTITPEPPVEPEDPVDPEPPVNPEDENNNNNENIEDPKDEVKPEDNNKVEALPQTGGDMSRYILLFVAVIVVAAGVIFLKTKKKTEEK